MKLFLLLSAFVAAAFATEYTWDRMSPLDDYVALDDGYYEWSFISMLDCGEYELHFLNMTSQKWMDETVTTTPIWYHYLQIAIPKTPRHLDAFHMYVDGGSYTGETIPQSCTEGGNRMNYIGEFAVNTGAIAIRLRLCPFQPLFFTDTPNIERVEDLIISRTWRYYIEEIVTDPAVVLPVPMVKAAKKAVDTVIAYAPEVNPAFNLNKVMPAGYSKRGWTTWLLGAVDRRVFSMVPIVLTVGGWYENLMHHYRSYGGWSWAMAPYYNENVTQYFGHPRAQEIFEYIGIDYMAYNPRLTMPKMVIHGAGDEFFLNDDPWYFYNRLTGPKHLLVCENDDHSLDSHQAIVNRQMMNYFEASLNSSYVWPVLAWSRSESADSGSIHLYANVPPLTITAWWADTTNRTCDPRENGTLCRRDFRLNTAIPPGENPITWQQTPVTPLGNGNYMVTVDTNPESGFRAFFIVGTFAGSRPGDEFHLSTEVQIIPNILPYPTCTSADMCHGRIV